MKPSINKTTVMRIVIVVLVVFAGAVFSNFTVSAAPAPQVIIATPTRAPTQTGARTARVAELTDLPSDVFTRLTTNAVEGQAVIGQVLSVGGTVRTLDRGNARIDINDGTIIRVSPKTLFTITQLEPSSPITRLYLTLGKVWITLTGGNMQVETPIGAASVRGSYLGVYYNADLQQIAVSCLETSGTCSFSYQGVTYSMTSLQILIIPPIPPVVRPMTGVEIKDWILVLRGQEVRGIISSTSTPEPRPVGTGPGE
ncbi:MAG: FecR domain-containing protein [Chloroflexi bacterium]|nr:FecR domain-containing protein [Chloroflexota bacterium]